MSKSLKGSSLEKFDSVSGSLGMRQGGGSLAKRLAQGLDIKAQRLRLRETFKLGGLVVEFARTGYDTLHDKGYEKETLYCRQCGFIHKDESLTACVVCKFDFTQVLITDDGQTVGTLFTSLNKFDYCCVNPTCRKPFYVSGKMSYDESEFVSAVGYRLNACVCYLDEKQKYNTDRQRDNRNRKIFEASKTRKPTKAKLENGYFYELDNINLTLSDTTGMTGKEVKSLRHRKIELLKILGITGETI